MFTKYSVLKKDSTIMKKKIANHNGKQRGGKTMANVSKFFELPRKKRVFLVDKKLITSGLHAIRSPKFELWKLLLSWF